MLKIIDDPNLVTELWEVINKSDAQQHQVSLSDLPPHRVSVVEAAEYYCNNLSPSPSQEAEQRLQTKVFAVHRLDCETSGVLFLAKTEEAAGEMGIQFRGRQVGKRYIAIVDGDVSETFATAQSFPDKINALQVVVLPQDPPSPSCQAKRMKVEHKAVSFLLRGSITAPIYGRYEDRPKQMVDFTEGKASHTEVDFLYTLTIPHASSDSPAAPPLPPRVVSCVALTPVSGRTHQLRVHLAHIGHPILGDTLYAPPDVMKLSPRLELHSHQLQCQHPGTGERLEIIAPITLSAKFLEHFVEENVLM